MASSQVPSRFTSGVSVDVRGALLANMGLPNPLFYHLWYDDFNQELAESGYTKTTSGNGTVALTAGDGGLALFTTNSSTPNASDICSIQLPAAGFSISSTYKQFFLARIQLSSAANAAFTTGLIQTTTTPFTVTDGLWFNKPTGALTGLTFNSTVGSTNTAFTIPVAYYTLANNTNIDLGFWIDRNQTIYVYVGSQLIGWIPQSGTGAPNSAGTPTLPILTPCLQISTSAGGAISGQTTNVWTPTTANLNPTLAIQSGTAASSTMTADFLLAAKER